MDLEFERNSKLTHILEKITSSNEKDIRLVVPKGGVLENPINREIVNRLAADLGKSLTFENGEPIVQNPTTNSDNLGFVEGEDVGHLAGDSAGETAVPVAAAPIPPVEKTKLKIPDLPKMGKFPKIPKVWLFLVIGAFGLGLILFGLLWLTPSAEVTLAYKPQTKDASSTLTAVVGANADTTKGTVTAQTDSVTKSDSATGKATGTKSVGTAAKGRVTIYNFSTTKEPVFLAGTTIKPVAGGPTFTTDSDFTAAKAAVPGTPGQTGVNVTSTSTGPSGNLAAQTLFQVGSVTDLGYLSARNDAAFSGGDTKTLTIVSASDQKSLHDQLVQKLIQAATSDLKSRNKAVIIPDGAIDTQVTKEIYDKSIGQEASELTLNLEVQTSAVLLQKSALQQALTETMSVPDGFKVDSANSAVTATSTTKLSDSSYKFKGAIKAVLIPNLDLSSVAKKLAGKRTSSATKYLSSLSGIDSYTVTINPSFFRIFGFLPFSASKIQVKLEESQ